MEESKDFKTKVSDFTYDHYKAVAIGCAITSGLLIAIAIPCARKGITSHISDPVVETVEEVVEAFA